VIALVVVVGLVLWLAPGHGALGWTLALVGALLIAVVLGLVGRRYPGIYGRRRR
jgi:uncharacterized membrane protein